MIIHGRNPLSLIVETRYQQRWKRRRGNDVEKGQFTHSRVENLKSRGTQVEKGDGLGFLGEERSPPTILIPWDHYKKVMIPVWFPLRRTYPLISDGLTKGSIGWLRMDGPSRWGYKARG